MPVPILAPVVPVMVVDGCKKGDQNSCKELFELFQDRIYSTAYRMLGNAEDSEDATQDAFIKIFRNIQSFRSDSSLLTWIYRITVNTCLDRLKSSKHREMQNSIEYTDDLEVENRNNDKKGLLFRLIEDEIHKLPKGSRTVFILYAIEGFTHDEVAKILDISQGTSKSQYFAAKALLRKKLLPYKEAFVNELQ